MDLVEKRKSWSRMLVQAAHFADLDNTIDALGRARLCLKDIDATIAALGEDETLAADRARARGRLEAYETLHAEWQTRTQARADEFEQHEEERYDAPLAKPGLD